MSERLIDAAIEVIEGRGTRFVEPLDCPTLAGPPGALDEAAWKVGGK